MRGVGVAFDKTVVDIGMTYADALTPLIAETFGFSETPAAFTALRQGRHVGKIVVTVSDGG